MISDEKIRSYISGAWLGSSDLLEMAKELQAYRKAFSAPVGEVYFDSHYGAQVSLDRSIKLSDGEVLYRKPATK